MKHINPNYKQTTKYSVVGLIVFISFLIVGINFNISPSKTNTVQNSNPTPSSKDINDPLYPRFQLLSTQGNSSCSEDFRNSISSLPYDKSLQGSCCSPMSWHRYKEQVEGLKKYKDISMIPSDPYDIEAGLAKKLQGYYNMELSADQQKEYDYAMQNSDEKGPCCCKCWRWYVYGGLGKYLIKEQGFTGKQVTEIWNLSDGCGGEGDHVNHT